MPFFCNTFDLFRLSRTESTAHKWTMEHQKLHLHFSISQQQVFSFSRHFFPPNNHLMLICPSGANWVSIVVTQYQKMHNTTEIFPLYTPQHSTQPPWFYTFITATDQQLRTIIRDAKKNHNIKVMLKPHIDLTNDDPQYWRGDIGKGFSSADWDQWFASYEKFFLPYARMAEEEKVDLLSLSCELIEASLQESHWRAFVPKVRKVKEHFPFFFILFKLTYYE